MKWNLRLAAAQCGISVPDLIAAIRAFIDAYNQRCEPFHWTKTAYQILGRARRQPSAANPAGKQP